MSMWLHIYCLEVDFFMEILYSVKECNTKNTEFNDVSICMSTSSFHIPQSTFADTFLSDIASMKRKEMSKTNLMHVKVMLLHQTRTVNHILSIEST